MHQKGSYGDREQPAADRRGDKPGRLPSLSSVKLIIFYFFICVCLGPLKNMILELQIKFVEST